MLITELQDLVDEIESQLITKNINFEKLEEKTTALIIDDMFETFPEEIQDEIFFVDNCDLEKPTNEHLKNSLNIIKDYLGQVK